jgi:predicted transposase YdaD
MSDEKTTAGTETPPDTASHPQPRNIDTPWKGLIEIAAFSIIKRGAPKLYEAIDLTVAPVMLDKELRAILPDEADSTRFVDSLIRVRLKGGAHLPVLVHIEVQGKGGDKPLPDRMYEYRKLIEAKYPELAKMLVAIAIILDDRGSEPDFYMAECYGTLIIYRYGTIKVPELDMEELAASKDILDFCLMSAVMWYRNKKDEEARFSFLKVATKRLKGMGLSQQDRGVVVRFITAILGIRSPEQRDEINEILQTSQGDDPQMYQPTEMEEIMYDHAVDIGVRRGRLQGIQEGIQRGRRENALDMVNNMLTHGFTWDQVTVAAGMPRSEIEALMAGVVS